MTDSIAERCLAELARRLADVSVLNGYKTNAGANTYRSRKSVDKGKRPCFVVWKLSEEYTPKGSDAFAVVLSATVECIAEANQENAGILIEELCADAKQAVMTGTEHAFNDAVPPSEAGELGQIIITRVTMTPRQDGLTSDGATIAFDIIYIEGRGNPYGQQTENPS